MTVDRPESADSLIDRLIGGRYRILARLASGGMGAVYLARQESLQREVVVKVIRPGLVDDAFKKRFEAEALATSRLKDPAVVTVHDYGIDGDLPYLVLERLDGTDLRSELDARGRFGWRRGVRVLRSIASALVAAEAAGVVHRDLKPANIFLSRAGSGDDVVTVLDFGIAKLLEPTGEEAHAAVATTEAGAIVGTSGYIAPERLVGGGGDHKSDLYSLGAIAWDVLAGRPPYRDASSLNLALKHLTEPVPRITAVVPIPPGLDDLVLRLLDKQPEARPTADTVIRTLDEISFAGTEPDLPPDSVTLPDALAPRSGDVLARVAAGIPAAVAAAASSPPPAPPTPTTTTPMTTTTAANTAAPTPARAGPRVAAAIAVAVVVVVVAVGVGVRMGGHTEAATSENPLAAAAYAAGTQSLHDANSWAAVRSFYRATSLDSGLAGAWLRIALVRRLRDATEAREAFNNAREHRTALSPRDARLLDATEPCVMADPWQWDLCEQRLRALADDMPGDPEVLLELGASIANSGKLDEAQAPLDRALALEPNHPRALSVKGTALAYAGRFDEARKLIDACFAASRGATDCTQYSAWLHDVDGRCDLVEKEARAAAAVNPEWPDAYGLLANTAVARGESDARIDEALTLKWRRAADGPGKEPGRLMDAARVAALHGDFVDAEQKARGALKLLADSPNEYDRAVPVRFLLELLRETMRVKEAAALASEYEARRGVLIVDPRQNHQAIARDISNQLWTAELRAGAITADDVVQRRDMWLASYQGASPTWRRYAWFYAYAAPAETEPEANAALAVLGADGGVAAGPFTPLPTFVPFINIADADAGKVYALAGRSADAVPWLTRATHSCRALEQPFEHTRAHYFLGLAREAHGETASRAEKDAACAAYAVVAARWGNAKPPSVTAARAKQNAALLGCTETRPR